MNININRFKKNGSAERPEDSSSQRNKGKSQIKSDKPGAAGISDLEIVPPEVLFISSYPPRECGIATYSQDLIKTLNNKFGLSFAIKVCALETADQSYTYTDEVKFILNTSVAAQFSQ